MYKRQYLLHVLTNLRGPVETGEYVTDRRAPTVLLRQQILLLPETVSRLSRSYDVHDRRGRVKTCGRQPTTRHDAHIGDIFGRRVRGQLPRHARLISTHVGSCCFCCFSALSSWEPSRLRATDQSACGLRSAARFQHFCGHVAGYSESNIFHGHNK